MKVIGVGFGRTGTLSTRTALDRLGIPCYHMSEVMNLRKNPGHLDFWARVARSEPGTQHDWNEVFENYEATVDNPAAAVWRELLEAYPDAKVLLTLHPKGPEAWHQSTWDTIYMPQRIWQTKLLNAVLPPMRKIDGMVRALIWDRFHEGTMESPNASVERYLRHERDVREAVPEDRLLVFRASDGWQPLCDFLGLEAPEEPFPRVNERAEMRRNLKRMASLAYVLIALAGAAIAALGWAVVQFLP